MYVNIQNDKNYDRNIDYSYSISMHTQPKIRFGVLINSSAWNLGSVKIILLSLGIIIITMFYILEPTWSIINLFSY